MTLHDQTFPEDLAQDVRIRLNKPSTPLFRSALILAGIGLAFIVIPALSSKPVPPFVSIAGWALLALAVVGALLAMRLARSEPFELRIGVDEVGFPSVAAWNPGYQTVPWSEVASIGPGIIGNAPSLVLTRTSAASLSIPLSLLPKSFYEGRWPQRMAARLEGARSKVKRAELAGLEALAISEEPLVAVVVQGKGSFTVSHALRDLDDYAPIVRELPADHVLVTGRPEPARALGLRRKQLTLMLDILEQAFRSEGVEGRLDRRNLAFFAPEGSFELFALCRNCSAHSDAEWDAIARNHVQATRRAARSSEEALRDVAGLDAVRSRLRVVLHGSDRLGSRDRLVCRAIDPSLVCVLAIVHEHGHVLVPRALACTWQSDDEELFRIARDNLRALPAPHQSPVPGANGVLYSGDEFTASRLLTLDQLLRDETEAVVAVPGQTCLIVSPGILDLLAKGPALTIVVQELHRLEARPLTPALYCWHHGRLDPMAQRGMTFELPEAYTGRITGRIPK